MTNPVICFDDVCFGWRRMDGSLDPLPMPTDWQFDARGHQIECSRMHKYGITLAEYAANAIYPTREERMAPVGAYWNNRTDV